MSAIDPAFKRQQFEALKAANDQGRLVPEKRKTFSRSIRQAILERQEGLCAACEERIFGKFDVDHIRALELGGSNDLPNLVALHPDCHRTKTKLDVRSIAKCKRIEKREVEGPPEPQIKSRNEWPKGQKLRGRGFEKRRSA